MEVLGDLGEDDLRFHHAKLHSELQVLQGEALVGELFEGVEADAEVVGDVRGIHFGVALGGFDAVGEHGLVADEEEGAGGDLVVEAGHEDGGGLHVDGEGADFAEVVLEGDVMLPHAAVGGVNGAGPVVALGFADGGGDGLLEGEGGQGGHFGRKVVVAGAFAADGGDREDEVADGGAVLEAAAFAEEEHGFRMDGGEQVHDRGGGGAAHAEIDDADASGGGVGHGLVASTDLHPVPLGEKLHVVGKICEEDVVAELLQFHARVSRQPVFDDVFAGLEGTAPGTASFGILGHSVFVSQTPAARKSKERSVLANALLAWGRTACIFPGSRFGAFRAGTANPASMTNIHPETRRFLDRASKERLLGQRGAVLWLYGLSGSGKSTIANEAERALHAEGRMTVILDGDNLRTGLNRNLGFSDEDRTENVRRVAETAKLLAGQGVIVLVSVITPLRAHRRAAAEIIGPDFHEVYVKADFDTCAQRDPKGLYAKAREGQIGQFTGKDSGFEEPEAAALVLDTQTRSVDECAADLLGYWRSIADGRSGA